MTDVICVRLDSKHWLLDVSAGGSDQLGCFMTAFERLTDRNETAYLIARGDAADFGARLRAKSRARLDWRVVREANGVFEAVVSSPVAGAGLAVH